MFDVPPSDDERDTSPRPQQQKRLKSPTTQPSLHRRLVPVIEQRTASHINTQDNAESMAKKRRRDMDEAEEQLLQENATHRQKTQSPPMAAPTMKPKSSLADGVTKAGVTKPASKVAKRRSPPILKAAGVSGVEDKSRFRHVPKIIKSGADGTIRNVSSPARLEEMVLESYEDLDVPVLDNSRPLKGVHVDSSSSPRTPPRANGSSASFASYPRSGSVTPRQTELWSKLLGTSDGTDSPSRLAVDKLRITGTSKKLAAMTMSRGISDVGVSHLPRRGRLIDTLAKNKLMTSAADESEEDESMTDDTSLPDTSAEDNLHAQEVEAEMAVASQSQAPSKVTYGQVRSYMEESTLEAELLLDSPLVPMIKPQSAAYGSQTKSSQPQPGSSQGEDEDLEDSQGPIKSVHELRAAGENSRFADDFENLLDDVRYRNSASWSRQRSGMIELCEKFMDQKYVGRMVDAGLDQRLLKACSGVPDTIFNFSVAASIALISNAEPPFLVLSHIRQSDCFEMLFKLLSLEKDVKSLAKDRKSNMSKVAQTSLADFSLRVLQSSIWDGSRPKILSPHILALRAIELLVRRMRRLKYMDDLLDEQKTSDLLQILDRRMAERKDPQQFDAVSLELALSTLESGSVIPGRIQAAWTPKRMGRLADVLPDILHLEAKSSAVLTPLALRLILNLTNGKPRDSTIFAKPSLVQLLVSWINEYFQGLGARTDVKNEEEVAIDDRVILSLGAMLNLAEFSDSARTPLLENNHESLNRLVVTFLENRGKAAEADNLALTASNVAYGYLTVLLGNLCENEDVKRAMAAQLPGGNLSTLIEAIEEFVTYNKAADRSGSEAEESRSVWRGFTERVANVAEKLRESEVGI